jgi:hypothetical protein
MRDPVKRFDPQQTIDFLRHHATDQCLDHDLMRQAADTIEAMLQGLTISRFEVFDETGNAYAKPDVSLDLSYQDDGGTLRVFIRPHGSPVERLRTIGNVLR